jgi:hypothetical protein
MFENDVKILGQKITDCVNGKVQLGGFQIFKFRPLNIWKGIGFGSEEWQLQSAKMLSHYSYVLSIVDYFPLISHFITRQF